VALVAVGFTLHGGATIVALLLMGYSFVTQLFPALLMSLLPRNPVTSTAAFAGIACGVATVAAVSLSHSSLGKLLPFLHGAWVDINVGIVALLVNVVAMAVVTAFTRRTQLAVA
jgi:SSS family solute:Na+ symporter